MDRENKKAAGQVFASGNPGSRFDLNGSFAWETPAIGRRYHWPEGLEYDNAGNVPVSAYRKNPMKNNLLAEDRVISAASGSTKQ
jgi:hypothetical protein